MILRECPESLITDFSRDMVTLFQMCHTVISTQGGPAVIPGPLPRDGGVLDQENATMEAMMVIREEILKK